MNGVELIAAERLRQVEEEGWTAEHDAEHSDGALPLAAACYAIPKRVHIVRQLNSSRGIDENCYSYSESKPGPGEIPWPWDAEWWKPSPDDRLRDLVKAGALIAAEIDRIQGGENDE